MGVSIGPNPNVDLSVEKGTSHTEDPRCCGTVAAALIP